MSNRAWVTLATNDSYGLGALVLAHSLRRAGSAYSTVVLITPSVTDAMRERLNTVYTEVITVDVLDSRDSAHLALLQRPELGITFTKLHCWSLTQYEKCVFLDADTLIIQNCDELFEREELSAAPDVGWPDCFNSGVFVFVPSQDTYTRLITFAQERGSFDGGDQGLLNAFFSDWAHGDINKHLPFLYNVTSAAFYSYLPAMKHYGQNLKIIHFIGAAKPWLQQYNWQSQSVDAPEHLRDFLQLWWNLFVGQVHTQLDTAMDPGSTVDLEDELETQPPVEIILEPPQDNFYHYAPTLDAESEFPWHHPEAQTPEAEARDQQIDMSDIYDPWQNYRGNIPPWNPGSSLGNVKEPENYVWDYLQQQETKDQSWDRPYHEYGHHNDTHEHIHQAHTHQGHFDHAESDHVHSVYHGRPDSYQHHYTHDSSQHRDLHHHFHQHHTHDSSHHQTHSHDQHESHDHPPQTDSFDHSPSLKSNEGSRINEHVHHNHDDHSHFSHSHHSNEPQNDSFFSHHQSPPGEEAKSRHERNEYHDHGHRQYPEAHIVTGDSHKHSEHRSLDRHHQDHWNHSRQTQRHKTEVYRIHLDLKKQRRRERLLRIRAQAVTSTAQTNGHTNGHHESESEDDDFIPRHPYDGFYLRHMATIDSRGRKICTHEIPPTPISSPPATPPPTSPHLNCSSPTASEEFETASDGEDDGQKETGVAGNLARVVPGAIEYQREAIDELSRRQGWEAGNIDYMGADSFANIWAKISQTLNQAPKQPSPPRKEPSPPRKEPTPPKEEAKSAEEVPAVAEAPKPAEASATSESVTELPKESTPVTETPVIAPEKTEPQVPPTPKSTPEGSTTPVTETAPSLEKEEEEEEEVVEEEEEEEVEEEEVEEEEVEEEEVEEEEEEEEGAQVVAPIGSQVTAQSTVEPKTEAASVKSVVSGKAKVDAPSPAETKVQEPAGTEAKLESPSTAEKVVETPAPAELAARKVEAAPPVGLKVEAVAPVEAKIEAAVTAEAKIKAAAPVEAKIEAAAPVEAKIEAAAPVEAKIEAAAPVVAKIEAAAPVVAKIESSSPVQKTAEAPAPADAKTDAAKSVETKVEAPASVEVPKVVTEVQTAAPISPPSAVEAPAATPAEKTPEKGLEASIATSTDSPPLANTPSKEEAPAVPSPKSEVRRKPVEKLQLCVPPVGDPCATPDSELEDEASLAQSIIASELRATVTSPSPSAETPPPPRPPLQPQRLSVEQPEVPTPPVSLEQIGVKPKSKPTTAALIASSVKTEPQSLEPSTPITPSTPTSSEELKNKGIKKVVQPVPGEAPVPPPRKKDKKPKEK